jgi:adenine-specific DNA-methyltransferase
MDDVFGPTNFRAVIAVKKTAGLGTQGLVEVTDYLLWYARNREQLKERSVYVRQDFSSDPNYVWVLSGVGEKRRLASDEQTSGHLPADTRLFRHQIFLAAGRTPSCVYPLSFDGEEFLPTAGRSWSTNQTGAERLARASRLSINGNSVNYLRFSTDWGRTPLSNMWEDGASGVGMNKVYVVQTNVKIVQRCMLMATDPSDLVLDPTCGSATTAYVAEQWGRRWITIDTSRVAIAIARQRLLTAKYDFFRLRDETVGVAGNFQYKTVPHITLKSIAQNPNLDPIFAKHEPILETKLAPCNTALGKVTPDIRRRLELKLIDKQRAEGKRAIIDADRRRWELPEKDQKWDQWQVPFDTDPDWPKELADAVTAYRNAWRSKMDEVNACIAANAEQEELVDEPEIVKGVVRVSGPFTVEAVQPPELSLGQLAEIESPISGAPESLDTFEVRNAEAYLDHMLKLLQMDGVRFPDNKEQTFSRLERVTGNDGAIHAEGRWVLKGEEDPDADGKATVAVAFGPQYGPVTAKHVENVIRATNRRGYDDLVIAGFSFDGPAQAIITESQHPKLRVHIAHIRPDVNPGMDGLLKEKPGSQLFTVFGQPRTTLKGPDKRGEYTVIMEGVDIYDPVTNTIRSTEDQKVAAWFLDGDYDGRTFCITQAFFPDRSAWEKLSKALNGLVDAERFEAFSGTVSLPFPPGKHRCVAVKVIDPRGNEVMQVHRLD